MTASAALSLVVFINLGHRGIETRTRHIGHISGLGILRLLVAHLAHILQEGATILDGSHSLRVAGWYTIHPYPVVTRTNGDNRNGNILDRSTLLDKQTIYNFVQRAITTNYDDVTITLIDRLHSKLRNVILMLREDQLVGNLILTNQLGDVG